MKLCRFSGPVLPVFLVLIFVLSSCRTVVMDAPPAPTEPDAPKEKEPTSRVEDRTDLPLNDFSPLTPLPLANIVPTVQLPDRAGNAPVDVRDNSLPYSLAQDLTKDLESPDELLPVEFAFDAEEVATVVDMFSYLLGEELTEAEIAVRQAELDAVTDLPPDPDDPDGEFDEEFEVPNVRPFAYYMDAGVSGAVTMTMDTEMTRGEAWELFQYILWLSGAYASRQKGFIHILPFAKMPQERRLLHKFPDPMPNVAVELVRLYHLTPSEMAGMIQPFMTEGSVATPVQHLNALLVLEAPDNIVKIRELIGQLDIIGETQWPQISIGCQHVEVAVVIEELQQILPVLGFGTVTSDKGDGRSLKLVGLERMQVLIASAPTQEVLDEIRRWVKILDNADAVQQQEQIYFYPVKYNKAEDLSDAIGVFFTQTSASASAGGSSSSSGSSTPSIGGRSTGSSATSSTGRSAASTRRTLSTSGSRSRSTEKPETIFDVPVTLFADGAHNRLIIRTTPQAYAMLEALLMRIDTPPLQVLVQVSIAEIQLNESTEFGFRAAALARIGGDKTLRYDVTPGTVADPYYSMTFATSGASSGADGISLVSPGDALSFIQAVAGKSNTKVLFSPQVIAISDQQATINVGDSVPVVTGDTTGATTGTSITRNIQYQDTGIILTVTPHITANKLVTLDLNQQVSDAVETTTSNIDSPTIQTRTLETSLIIEDKQTVLLGGMISSRSERSRRGIPGTHKIPFVGKFLTASDDSTRRSELLLLISVQVIDMKTDVDKLLERYQSAIEAIKEDLETPHKFEY
ncbi:MAG: general secretion pathway protein D [Rhodothermales bacterium]|jgi:general secretion pathway protein D